MSRLVLPLCLCALVFPSSALGANIDVVFRADDFTNNTNCSLREAVDAANQDNIAMQVEDSCTPGNGLDTITLHAGSPYMLTTMIDGAPGINDGDLEVTDPDGITVSGEGAAMTIVDGGDFDRIFEATSTVGVFTLSGVTVRNGTVGTSDGGGGIHSSSGLTLSNASVVENRTTAVDGDGGGIKLVAGGALVASGATHIDDNMSARFGGGIADFSDNNAVTLNSGVTVDGNSAVGFGGGLMSNSDNSALTINGASISDNQLAENASSVAAGSGIEYLGNAPVQITGATINSNDSVGDNAGPALRITSQVLATITSTTVSNNTATGQDDAGGDILGPAGISLNNTASTTITGSTIISNSVVGVDIEDAIFGGGILNSGNGGLTIDASTVALNTIDDGLASSRSGAGLFINFNVPGTGIINSTFTANDAGVGGGGGVHVGGGGDLTVGQSTFATNLAMQGPAINSQGGAASEIIMRGSIFDQGMNGCAIYGTGGAVTANAFNVDAGESCVDTADDADFENTDADLGGLATNGGPTDTKALFGPASILNGAMTSCKQLDGTTNLLVDQRGAPRPTDGGCEPGAYEIINCFGQQAFVGTAGADALVGDAGVDVIDALGGNDSVDGAGGNDRICGGTGDDDLTGGTGMDSVFGDAGADDLFLSDGAQDTGDCGADTDTALVDPGALDTVMNCETVGDGTTPPVMNPPVTTPTTPATTTENLACAALRAKLKKAKSKRKKRKIRAQLRKLGC